MMHFSKKIPAVALIILTTILSGSCGNLSTRPKKLGGVLTITPEDTATQASFRFLYAYRDDDANTTPDERVVQLKGAENSTAAIVAACNSVGTGCFCDFYDGGTLLGTSDAGTAGISYSNTQNLIRCYVPAAILAGQLPDIDNVIVRNSDSSITSTATTLYKPSGTDLSLAQMLHGLDTNKVRTVYRYKCKRTFLQKTATTYLSFDCTDQGAADLNFLHSDATFFLYGGNTANNYSEKLVDLLYNSGSTGSMCNMQVKQYDCVNTVTPNAGIPSKAFGVYGENADAYSTQVTLTSSPTVGSSLFGYAAPIEEFPIGSGTFVCPPGLKRFDSFTAQLDASAFVPASNMPDKDNGGTETIDATDTEVWPIDLGTPLPTAVDIQQTINGDCNGTVCTYPSGPTAATGTTAAYTASGSRFCVIPTALLP